MKFNTKNKFCRIILGLLFFCILTESFFLLDNKSYNNGSFLLVKPKNYLPVCISVNNFKKNDFSLFLASSLKKKGIRIINKEDAQLECELEMRRVLEGFFRNKGAGEMPEFEEVRRKAFSELEVVVNYLQIKYHYDSIQNRIDTLTYQCTPGPYNIGNPYKGKIQKLDLTVIDTLPLLNFTAVLCDSIINANILFKEK